MGSSPRNVFIAGGTGYIGTRLIKALLRRGHQVRALARQGSERKLPAGAVPVTGDALHGISYAGQVPPSDTFVHLVGVSHPSPAKAQDFLRIDLASVQAAVPAAVVAGIRNFVYVSVAHPAPVMRAYVAARMRAEEIIRSSGLAATMIRPWYVLGPGHRWPYAMVPVYWLLKLLPPTRAGALRLGLVTWRQMVSALVYAVEAPSDGLRVMEVPEIRAALDFQAI
ncbi:MAG TPA: NAD(P)H-binding protein [Gemmatimonadales bacterium]|jgi:uncharacterized protein YbjT (DUF2867 family)|nr:NAD(P)H-binding protein [Gemmatimonadales bacterium]